MFLAKEANKVLEVDEGGDGGNGGEVSIEHGSESCEEGTNRRMERSMKVKEMRSERKIIVKVDCGGAKRCFVWFFGLLLGEVSEVGNERLKIDVGISVIKGFLIVFLNLAIVDDFLAFLFLCKVD